MNQRSDDPTIDGSVETSVLGDATPHGQQRGPALSVVFPVHPLGAPLLQRSVLALRAQTVVPSRFEVVVAIDGGDPDGCVASAIAPESQPFACRVVPSPRPKGDLPHRNHARNTGCRAARGALLWVLDCDFLLPPHAIEHLLHEHDKALGTGRSAVFSPVLGGVNHLPNAWLERSEEWVRTGDPARYATLMNSTPLDQREYSGFADRYRPGPPDSEPCPTLPEGFPTCPRDLWAALGGYDESFVGWGGNKREFVDRLRSLARERVLDVRLLTSVRVLHQPHPGDPTGDAHNPLRRANHALLGRRAAEIQADAPWWAAQRARARVVLRSQSCLSEAPEAATAACAWTVVVMTCNRPALLMNLLQDLEREAARGVALNVIVYDDASEVDLSEPLKVVTRNGWVFRRASARHGKKGYWRWVDQVYKNLRGVDPRRRLVFLPDDCRLCARFFERALAVWQSIDDPLKLTLNLLVDSGRESVPCWTNVPPERRGAVWRTQWVDGAFLAERRYLDALDFAVPPVPASRWHRNPELGSGVGAGISTKLHRSGWGMYRVDESLVDHIQGPSEMNPVARRKQPLTTVRFVDRVLSNATNEAPAREPVLASMATIPGREATLARTVASLLPQVSRLRVYLNGHEHLPSCLLDPRVDVVWSRDHGDHGDAGKFWWCEVGGGYLFTCDDDIVYPADYVVRMVGAIEQYKRSAVVGVHGVLIHDRVRSYYRDRKVLHTVNALAEDRPVHLVATSSSAWHASTLVVRRADFQAPNMADIWLGVVCQRQKVPVVAVSRRAGWLQVQAVPTSIYDSYRQRDELQSRVVAEHCPWKIFSPP